MLTKLGPRQARAPRHGAGAERRRCSASSSIGDAPRDDGTRIFDFSGRGDPPPRIVAVWDGVTYQVENSRSVKHLKVERTKQLITGTLGRIGSGRSGEILAAWPSGGMKMPSERTLMRHLRDLESEGRIEVTSGGGGANDPRVYRITKIDSGIPA